jgi:hypothetical protein
MQPGAETVQRRGSCNRSEDHDHSAHSFSLSPSSTRKMRRSSVGGLHGCPPAGLDSTKVSKVLGTPGWFAERCSRLVQADGLVFSVRCSRPTCSEGSLRGQGRTNRLRQAGALSQSISIGSRSRRPVLAPPRRPACPGKSPCPRSARPRRSAFPPRGVAGRGCFSQGAPARKRAQFRERGTLREEVVKNSTAQLPADKKKPPAAVCWDHALCCGFCEPRLRGNHRDACGGRSRNSR